MGNAVRKGGMLNQVVEAVTTDARLKVWLASERRERHLVIQCSTERLAALGLEVVAAAAPPVRVCTLPGALQLPSDRTGTLLISDIAALQLHQQIALFDWLGLQRATPRVVALTAQRMDRLVESGAFLEGLFHRLGSVQLQLTGGPTAEPSTDRPGRVRNGSRQFSRAEKVVCGGRMCVEG
jgi:transcriptional regulator of acetoin/glycerol metabolism